MSVLSIFKNRTLQICKYARCIYQTGVLVIRKSFHTADRNFNKDTILVEKLDSITLIGINRPEKRNCINHATAKALYTAVKDFDKDDSSYAAVLYGVQGNFCSGYDLSEVEDPDNLKEMLKNVDEIPGMSPMGPCYYTTSKPVVGAIDGYAVAGGFELALWCDLRVIEESTIMGIFNRRFGVPLIDGGAERLPAMVGVSRAMELILTGRSITNKEAREWGLVHHVADYGCALGRAIKMANSLRKFPQKCMQRDRQTMLQSAFSPFTLQEALKNKASVSDDIYKEAIEGARKFKEGIGKHGSTILHSDEEIKSYQDVPLV